MPNWGKSLRELAKQIESGEVEIQPSIEERHRDRVLRELSAIRRLLQRQAGVEASVPDHWLRERGDMDLCANCGQVLDAHWFDGEWDRCRPVPFRSYQAKMRNV